MLLFRFCYTNVAKDFLVLVYPNFWFNGGLWWWKVDSGRSITANRPPLSPRCTVQCLIDWGVVRDNCIFNNGFLPGKYFTINDVCSSCAQNIALTLHCLQLNGYVRGQKTPCAEYLAWDMQHYNLFVSAFMMDISSPLVTFSWCSQLRGRLDDICINRAATEHNFPAWNSQRIHSRLINSSERHAFKSAYLF